MIGPLNGKKINGVSQNGALINGNAGAAIHPGADLLIRRYQPRDRDAIRRLCCDTGFLGNPIEAIFTDRDVFADLFTRPYLDFESRWAWVAESPEGVAGYLLGSVSPLFHYTLLFAGFQTTLKMLRRAALGRYKTRPRDARFVRWVFTSGYREQPRHPDRAAHLHLNVDKAHRGLGLARRLWHAFETELRTADVQRCYGAFFSFPRRRPEQVYSRFGFSVFDRKPTTLFQPEISEPVEIVCVEKQIGR
ncbi:MAG: GNAT family N-acetyltransferase [Verrucomicrobiota bacterium]|nr:GNAT family N-acetyltransferase [Verrucomicrobiota bacterium]